MSAVAYTYDPASQVTNILHQIVSSATQINQAAYAYNPVGNRTSLTDRRGAQAFGYDSLDRLTSASHPFLATPQAFAYDPVGNRRTERGRESFIERALLAREKPTSPALVHSVRRTTISRALFSVEQSPAWLEFF